MKADENSSTDLQEGEEVIVRVISPRLTTPMHYFEQGNRDSDSQNYEEAIRHYRTAVKSNDDLGEAHYNMGLAYQHLENSEMADKCFAKATKHGYISANTSSSQVPYDKPSLQLPVTTAKQSSSSTLTSSTAVPTTPAKANVQMKKIPLPGVQPDHVKSKSCINCVIL